MMITVDRRRRSRHCWIVCIRTICTSISIRDMENVSLCRDVICRRGLSCITSRFSHFLEPASSQRWSAAVSDRVPRRASRKRVRGVEHRACENARTPGSIRTQRDERLAPGESATTCTRISSGRSSSPIAKPWRTRNVPRGSIPRYRLPGDAARRHDSVSFSTTVPT